MSRTTPRPSPFPPRTGFALAFDDLIAHMVELRLRPIVVESVDENSPADLRALVDLTKYAARAMDALLQRCAYEAGLTSMSGASEYVGIVSDAVADELLPVITARADKIEDERGGESQSAIDRREHSTINKTQLGL